MSTLTFILLILAAVVFLLATAGMPSKVDLIGLGLFLVTLAEVLPRLAIR